MKLKSIQSIARALNRARVRFIVVGGMAVAAHGYERQTQDLDLVIRLEPESIHRAFKALARLGYRPTVPVTSEGFADPRQRSRWIREKGMKVLNFYSDRHRETPLDMFVTEPFDFRTEYRSALVEQAAPGVPLRIVRLQTLLRLKRRAARPQDLADIAELRLIHKGDIHAKKI